MRRSPSIATALPRDVNIYLVLDGFGGRLMSAGATAVAVERRGLIDPKEERP